MRRFILRHVSIAVNRATAETVLSGLAGQLVVVISGVLVARMLGVENRGQFALIALLPLVLSQLGTLGLPVAITYHIAQGVSPRALVERIRVQALVQILGLLLIHAIVAWFLFGGRGRPVEVAAAFSLIVTPAAVAQVWGLAILQGEHRFRSFNILRLLGAGIYSLLLIVIYTADQGTIIEATTAWVAGSILSSAVICTVALRGLTWGARNDAVPSTRELYSFGLRGLLGAVFPVETFQLDQFYIGLVLSPAALGLYVVAAATTNLTRFFLPQSIGMVAYPQVASARSFTLARRSVWQFFLLTLALCGAVVGALELAVGWLIPFVFGAGFAGAVPVARVLLLGSLFLAGRRVLAEGSRGAGLPGMGAWSEVVAVAVAIPALTVASGSGLQSVTWALTSAYGASLVLMVVATLVVLSPDRSRHWSRSGDTAQLRQHAAS